MIVVSLGAALAVFLVMVPERLPWARTEVTRTLMWLAANRIAPVDPAAGQRNMPWTRQWPLPVLVRLLRPAVSVAYRERVDRMCRQLRLSWCWEDLIALKSLAALVTSSYFGLMWMVSRSSAMSLFALVAPALAWCVPDRWLIARVERRKARIRRELPGVLGALAITTEAGLSLPAALEEVGQSLAGELSEELRTTSEQISLGTAQAEALQAMADRCQVPELTLLVGTLLQSFARGVTDVVDVIRQQADEAWQRRKSRAEALAQQASIKLFLPLLLLVFPAMVIFLLSPAVISLVRLFSGQP